MVDSLKSFQDAMNGIPDNISSLVSPQNTREAWLSMAMDHGVATVDQTQLPVTVPCTRDVITDIPSALIAGGAPMNLGTLPLFWRMDANGHLYYDYAADWPNTEVPPGYQRSVALTAVMAVNLASTGNIYGFGFLLDGVRIGQVILVDEAQNQDSTLVALEAQWPITVADAPRVSVGVTNFEGNSDLNVAGFGFRTVGAPPA